MPLQADELEAASRGVEANRKLKGIEGRLLDLRLKAKGAGRSTSAIDAALSRAKEMRREAIVLPSLVPTMLSECNAPKRTRIID